MSNKQAYLQFEEAVEAHLSHLSLLLGDAAINDGCSISDVGSLVGSHFHQFVKHLSIDSQIVNIGILRGIVSHLDAVHRLAMYRNGNLLAADGLFGFRPCGSAVGRSVHLHRSSAYVERNMTDTI